MYNSQLITRVWRGFFEARLEAFSASMNLLSDFFAPRPRTCVETRSDRCTPVVTRGIAPDTVRTRYLADAAISRCESVSEEWAAIPLAAVQRFWDVVSEPPPVVCPQPPAPAPRTSAAAAGIVAEADSYLSQVPGEGALLTDLVANVSLKTGIDDKTVQSVVLRNFQSNGRLVWRADNTVATGVNGTIAQMRATLLNLGYTDIRQNEPLTAIPQRADRAALLAYNGLVPAVLCYPVERGEVEDPMIREAALFQAGAVTASTTAHYVWVSDNVSDFFYDFSNSVVVSSLPARVTPVVAP
jgi:hypothetical protein